MPPCSPEKEKDQSAEDNSVFYYITGDSSASNSTENLEDAQVQAKMDRLVADFPDIENIFYVNGLIGEGTFSTVFLGKLKNAKSPQNEKFAIKHVIPTCHPDRIKFELQCLKTIGGSNNVAGVNLCLRNKNSVVFVMPFQYHEEFCDYVGLMDAGETATYMKNLMIALSHVHKHNVIHRDIKPNNFLYNRSEKTFLLVDFGLAHMQSTKSTRISGQSTPATKDPNGAKRKRNPLSPMNGLTQDAKRMNLQPPSATPSSTSGASVPEKENKPSETIYVSPRESARIHKQRVSTIHLQQSGAPGKEKVGVSEPCRCYGRPQVCSKCTLMPPMQASRAGTPGFRPPEVLFKSTQQTTAVDIWAAGVILLSILSNSTQVFTCPNDIAALLELVTLFGYDSMKKAAGLCGRYFTCSEKKPGLDLRKVCCTLRNRGSKIKKLLEGDKCSNCAQYKRVCFCPNVPLDEVIEDKFPPVAYDLLLRLLDVNPQTRITADDALKHPFLIGA